MRNPWLARLLPLTLLPACVVRLPDDEGAEGDDEVGETADESTDASEATSAGTDTSEATSESTDATDTTGETDTSDTTDTGTDECPPLPESPAFFDYSLDIDGMGLWDADITWPCTVIEANTLDGLSMTLDCPDTAFPVSLSVLADPLLSPQLPIGTAITLRYVSVGSWWYNQYLRIDIDGVGHLFTIIDGDALQPWMVQFELPFPITTVSGICDPGPADCGDSERLGLAFELGGEAIVMFDPEYADFGGDPGTDVWVTEASHVENLTCTDTPNDWFRVMIANTGWQ